MELLQEGGTLNANLRSPTSEFRRTVQTLAPVQGFRPEWGFFGPSSMMWRVSREWVLQLSGVRAVLMQLAHPKVAKGVADHSNFQGAFVRRALNTYLAANDLIFGDRETAIRCALKLHAMHARVRGRLDPGDGNPPGDSYEALDQTLLQWVYATLVDSIALTHDTFLGTLDASDWERYYEESKVLAILLGIDTGALPAHLPGLRQWMDEMMAREIAVTPTALKLAEVLRRGTLLTLLTQPAYLVVAIGSLPPQLREAYGLPDSRAARWAYDGGVRIGRAVLPRLPVALRTAPLVWAAYWRCKRVSSKQRGVREANRLRTPRE